MKERDRYMRYKDTVVIRIKNRRLIIERDGDFYFIKLVSVQKGSWRNKDFDSIKTRFGITVTTKLLKLTAEGMDALFSGYTELQNPFPKSPQIK